MPHDHPAAPPSDEVMDEAAFTAEEITRACGMSTTWLCERVEAGVLHARQVRGEWRFDSTTLVRARRIAHLETTFDADPQLAALTADLIDELARLRRQLRMLGATQEAAPIEPD